MSEYQKGSKWRKWDLHVHTPASAIAHVLGDSWDIYVARLIESAKEHEISAIATADYFTIDGYKKLLEYYDQNTHTLSVGEKKAQLYIIPGAELRLNIFNSLEDSINLHVFFDPECCSSDFITQNFLEELTTDYRGSKLSLKQQNLLAIGKSIADNAIANFGQDFSGIDNGTKTGYMRKALGAVTLSYGNIDDTLKAIGEIFEKRKLPPKAYLIAVVGKGHGGINSLKWFEVNKSFSRAGLTREHLTHQTDIIFSNNPDDRKFYLGKHAETPAEEIEARFNQLKPCVWGSDSHSLDKLLHPSNGNTFDYTWIKAEVSFEGLKQITYEPELRVRVQQDDPSEEEAYTKIEKIIVDFPSDLKIKDKESDEEISFCIQGKQEISMSSNLSCIIGGRGSGKSTLVHILYNSVPGRDSDRLDKVNSPLFDLQLGSRDELGKVRSLTKADIPSRAEFFLQNEVEKFARDINEMSALVRTRLYGLSTLDEAQKGLPHFEKDWQAAAVDVEQLISAYDEMTAIDEKIELIRKQIETLKKQTDVISSTEYKKLQEEIEKIAGEISAFETYEKEYNRVVQEILALIKNINRLDWGKYGSQPILSSLSTELNKTVTELKAAFDTAKNKHNEADNATKLNVKKTELKKLLKEKGLSPENVVEVAAATEQVAQLEADIKLFREERVPSQEVYDHKDEVLQAYNKAYSSYKEKFQAVADKLHATLGDLNFDDQRTKISFKLKTNDQLLKDAISEFIKNNNLSRVSLRSDSIQTVIFGNMPISDLVSDKSKIIESVNKSEFAGTHTQIIQELISNASFAEKLFLRMQQHYLSIDNIQVQTRLGDKLLQNTSFGERCGIVIAIVLVAGTNPIIIDQPEDNLDGKYISNVLVPLIRDHKQHRQIILVTRDANIAIGGDSELILILDKDATGTKLLPATIENKKLRSKYIWILDGGERAFQRREEKYSIHKVK
jgi:exonuclease SbcC